MGCPAQAIEQGGVIGILATNPTTLDPTRQALEKKAREKGKAIDVRLVLVDGAFSALMAGDGLTHGRLVCLAMDQMVDDVERMVLAQASMARVFEGEAVSRWSVPVLSSPSTALRRVKDILEGGGL